MKKRFAAGIGYLGLWLNRKRPNSYIALSLVRRAVTLVNPHINPENIVISNNQIYGIYTYTKTYTKTDQYRYHLSKAAFAKDASQSTLTLL